MKKHSLELTALDTLFFKDGKPFTMGEESWAKGIFPPYPSTIYGMLRSIWFADNLDMLAHANSKELDPSLNLVVKGYLPALNGAAAFPIPADLYGEGKRDASKVLHLEEYPEELLSEYGLPHLLRSAASEKFEELHGKAYLLENDFRNYLNAQGDSYPYALQADYTCEEPKIGIGRDRLTRTTSEGKLYRLSMRRMAKQLDNGTVQTMSFLLDIDGLELPDKGISRFGAETKSASYLPKDFPNLRTEAGLENNRFKIYLATPAVFADGTYPKTWFANNGLKLIAAAMGKPAHIGGFDIQAGRPKPMYKAVPAGTVFYVEIIDEDLAMGLQEKLHQGSIYNLAKAENTFAANYKSQGFGLSFIGNIHQPQN